MMEFIFLLIGLMLGGCVGVVTMCLLQINRSSEYHYHRKDKDDDETYR